MTKKSAMNAYPGSIKLVNRLVNRRYPSVHFDKYMF